jgi:peptide deformylase
MVIDLVDQNHPLLKEELAPFDFANPPVNPVELANNLIETMNHHNGIGLSANQVGLPYRVFVMRSAPDAIVCFNPRIVDESSEIVQLEEGCLTYPFLFVPIKRPKLIKVRYTMYDGETVTKKFDGITSRCFQHELDHLNGVAFLRRANLYHLEKAKRKATKLAKNSKEI